MNDLAVDRTTGRAIRKAPFVWLFLVAFFCTSCALPGSEVDSDSVELVPGMIIDRSITIRPGHYQIEGDSLGAIQIKGDNIVVDFNGAILDGGYDGQMPDEFEGVGIRVVGSASATIKNAVVKGYKVAVIGVDVPDIHILHSDFSYNWRQRLKSTIERESNDDWMSYHNNEADEWLRFGAAVYLRRADRARIEHVTVTGGENGLMLTEVNDGTFINNKITFNSAIGIGLYRSSRNTISHNRLDFNVRGHSPGVYNRGQDSAALLLYEQSNENTIAYNSATHSGDGLFLWAGQSTMDTGEGGCNDNLIYNNDFSFAPTNGIEVTFSRYQIIQNRIEGCWHGIWGGYSFDTIIEGNVFVDNEEHIAVEHGQRLTVGFNSFTGGDIGLRFWERETQPADWGYSQARNVESTGHVFTQNSFAGVDEAFDLENTSDVTQEANDVREAARPADEPPAPPYLASVPTPDPLPGAINTQLPAHIRTGRNYMLIDEWGPYDFRSPVLWPRSVRSDEVQTFELLGPSGDWRIASSEGIESFSRTSGTHTVVGEPDRIEVVRSSGRAVNMSIDLEFVGEAFTDRFGRLVPAGEPFIIRYEHFYLPIDWTVQFFAWNEQTDPRAAYPAFRQMIDRDPVLTELTTSLAYQWYRAPAPGLPENQFATVAVGAFTIPDGEYEIDLTSDDGVRLWLDGELIHDDWTYHAPRQETIRMRLGGQHTLRAEHFEIDGYSTLILAVRPLFNGR
jgi:parallel beta-helix repeat protein